MNKKAKAFLIPLAAFAVTVTGASAFNQEVLEEAGLSDEQISAFEAAHELRQEGNRDGARDILVEAGVDEETMHKVRESMREHREANRDAVKEAVDNNDYDAFQDAVEGSPIAEIVDTEADFEQFVKAHDLREEAREIMEDLGFEKPDKGERGQDQGHGQSPRGHGQGGFGGVREN